MEVNNECFPAVKEEMDSSEGNIRGYSSFSEKNRSPYENSKIPPTFINKTYEERLHDVYDKNPFPYDPHRLYDINNIKRLDFMNKPVVVSTSKSAEGKEQLTCSPDFVQELAILTELSQQLHQKDKILQRGHVQSNGEILNLRSERQEFNNENSEGVHVGDPPTKSEFKNCRRKFECEDCHKNFPSKLKLHVHSKAHSSEEEKLQCDVCQMRFAHKTGYTRHIRSHNKSNSCPDHRNTFPTSYNSVYNNYNSVYGSYTSPYNGDNPVPNGENWSQCDICKTVFVSKLEFNKHKRTHFQPKERHFKCSECQKCFVSRSSLSTHEKAHKSERNFKCEDCGISFHRNYFLRQHSKIHSGKKIYTCPECCHNFTTKLALNVHTRIHTGEKPYECNYCGKCFTCKFYLDTHIRTHTGEKPFKCEICEKCFSQKSTLNTHKRLHARYNNTDTENQ